MTAPALRLYQATDALATVRAWIDEHEAEIVAAGGELPAELSELVDLAESQFESKVERVALFIRELLATADGVGTEVARLAARQKALEHTAKGLKAYLQHQLEAAGIDKVQRPLVTVALQRNSTPSVRLADGHSVDDPATRALLGELVRAETIYSLDSKRAAVLHKAGDHLPDIVTVEVGRHVRVR